MDLSKNSGNLLRKSFVLLLAMATTTWASVPQKKAPGGGAPAPHPSAPAQHAPAARPGGGAPAQHAPAQHAPSAPHQGGAPGHPANQQQHAGAGARPGATQSHPGAKPGATNQGSKTAGGSRPGAPGTKPGGGSRPGPGGTKTAGPGSKPGAAGGHSAPHTVSLSHGGSARVGSNGQIRSVNRNGMHIEHNMHGGRTIASDRGGKHIVTTGRHGGYVQKSYMSRGGHSYYSRTYYDHGHYHAGLYRGYGYGGHTYYGYYPTAFYAPAFYGWAYNPWPGPIAWGVGLWGWAGAPWYAYYGFDPYPAYTSPAFWLTDYLIAANLQAAYAALAEAPVAAAAPATPGTPLRIIEHEGTGGGDSPVFTFNGNTGVGQFGTGNQPLTIESFDGTSIAIRRHDTSGPWGGSALYAGQIAGNFVIGQVTYFDPNGGTRSGVWRGTILGFAPAAAPAPVADAPAAAPTGSEPVTLTPEVKQAIAEEVKAQLQAESAEAKSGSAGAATPASGEVPPALDPARRTFVVNADLAVTADGTECSLTQGDVITRLTETPDGDQKVNASVTSSKKNDCAAGKMVAVSVDDLQEMRNHFAEQLDNGMKTLASKQGTGKMPKAPSTATTAGDVPAPTPDTTAAQDLKDQQATADQTEQEVKQEAGAQ